MGDPTPLSGGRPPLHDDRPPPGPPEALTAPWLTAALEDAGVARGAVVEAVELEGDIGTGQAARSVRFRLDWDRPEGRPATIVGKFPAEDASARAVLAATGGYWKEWCFYTQLAPTVAMRVPRCHVALFDAGSSDFVLLMEDIEAATQGDQLVGLDADRLDAAVAQAAELHGPRFGDRTLDAVLADGPGALPGDEAGPFCEEMYGVARSSFLDDFGGRLDDQVVSFIERTAGFVSRWFQGTDTPRTLIHFDFRADNLLFATPGGEDPVVVVDFQAMTTGVGATDLAYLVGGSVADRAARAAIEGDLLEGYRRRLATFGVEMSPDALWRDYRHGSLWGVIMTVMSSIGTVRTERGDELFAAMIERHAHHALDLEALDALV